MSVGDAACSMQLSPLERGTGSVIGISDVAPLPHNRPERSARDALETVIGRALRRSPCVVSFSGGRDSSSILALATHVARRDGLPLPIPVSLVFPNCNSSHEYEWQDFVVRHLGLPDWCRLSFDDEMDIVGPIATPVLKRHGLLWPFNAFFHVPIFDLATHGAVLTGVFGDELMGSGWAWHRENQVAQRLSPPRPADLIRVAVSMGPRTGRAAFLRLRNRAQAAKAAPRPPWLRPDAFQAVMATQRKATTYETLSFERSVRHALWPLRSRTIGQESMKTIGRDRDSRFVAPFADPVVVSAFIAERGWRMFPSRADAVRSLVGDLLPDRLFTRTTKAWFDGAFFNRHARSFARSWDGSGLDSDYVDIDQLRRVWTEEEEPDARTYQLLQRAWLAQHQRGNDSSTEAS